MIAFPIKSLTDALDKSFWALRYQGQVVEQSGDFSLTLLLEDGTQVPNVGWIGGHASRVIPGQQVVFGYDSRGVPYVLGPEFVGLGAEFAVLGEQLIAALNTLVTEFNTHVHATAGTGTPSPPAVPATSIPSTILSSSVVVQK